MIHELIRNKVNRSKSLEDFAEFVIGHLDLDDSQKHIDDFELMLQICRIRKLKQQASFFNFATNTT